MPCGAMLSVAATSEYAVLIREDLPALEAQLSIRLPWSETESPPQLPHERPRPGLSRVRATGPSAGQRARACLLCQDRTPRLLVET